MFYSFKSRCNTVVPYSESLNMHTIYVLKGVLMTHRKRVNSLIIIIRHELEFLVFVIILKPCSFLLKVLVYRFTKYNLTDVD